jgi:hypothetical protein
MTNKGGNFLTDTEFEKEVAGLYRVNDNPVIGFTKCKCKSLPQLNKLQSMYPFYKFYESDRNCNVTIEVPKDATIVRAEFCENFFNMTTGSTKYQCTPDKKLWTNDYKVKEITLDTTDVTGESNQTRVTSCDLEKMHVRFVLDPKKIADLQYRYYPQVNWW